jgi:hypothetical protein
MHRQKPVGKATVATMVVCELDAMLGGKTFEGMLCINHLGGCQISCHQVDKLQTQD